MTIKKALIIMLAVIALGLFAIAGSVIYAAQQIPEKTTCTKHQVQNAAVEVAHCFTGKVQDDVPGSRTGGY